MVKGKTIDDENQALIRQETKHWKAVIERIISLLQTSGMQNLALRADLINYMNSTMGIF